MRVVYGKPPIYDRAMTELGADKDTIFTWGDDIYSPEGRPVPPHLVAHEEVHSWQQREVGPEAWWEQYFNDSVFRFEQEVEAYRRQYAFIVVATENAHYRMSKRRAYLKELATNLAGPMYGYLTSVDEAMRLIRRAA